MVSYKELRKKEVICIKDCRRLGHVCDLEIDECKGCICKIIVPGCKGFWSMLTDDSVIAIPYNTLLLRSFILILPLITVGQIYEILRKI